MEGPEEGRWFMRSPHKPSLLRLESETGWGVGIHADLRRLTIAITGSPNSHSIHFCRGTGRHPVSPLATLFLPNFLILGFSDISPIKLSFQIAEPY